MMSVLTFIGDCLSQTTPLLLAALGGAFSRRAGLVNVGLDAFILLGALVAAVVARATGSPMAGLGGAAMAGGAGACLMAAVVSVLRTNPIVTGLGFNLLSHAFCRLVVKAAFGVSGLLLVAPAARLAPLPLPVPLHLDILAFGAWACVFAMDRFFRHHWLGLHLRAAGAAPAMARAVGISARRMLFVGMAVAGALCGLGGADLSLGIVGAFSDDISAGRGYVALAAFYVGRDHPWPTALVCLVLGVAAHLATDAQVIGLPVSIAQAFPYVAVLVLMCLQQVRARSMNGGFAS
ncbi:ABC transporter permease [Komagataeibacter sp. FNDCR1]|nr:ABC transporter permease [Komagataeibacter sp. FNDCR1]